MHEQEQLGPMKYFMIISGLFLISHRNCVDNIVIIKICKFDTWDLTSVAASMVATVFDYTEKHWYFYFHIRISPIMTWPPSGVVRPKHGSLVSDRYLILILIVSSRKKHLENTPTSHLDITILCIISTKVHNGWCLKLHELTNTVIL